MIGNVCVVGVEGSMFLKKLKMLCNFLQSLHYNSTVVYCKLDLLLELFRYPFSLPDTDSDS